MKLNDVKRHLRGEGCEKDHEGGDHEIWTNRATGQIAPLFRHNEEIGAPYVARVCKQLGIKKPAGR